MICNMVGWSLSCVGGFGVVLFGCIVSTDLTCLTLYSNVSYSLFQRSRSTDVKVVQRCTYRGEGLLTGTHGGASNKPMKRRHLIKRSSVLSLFRPCFSRPRRASARQCFYVLPITYAGKMHDTPAAATQVRSKAGRNLTKNVLLFPHGLLYDVRWADYWPLSIPKPFLTLSLSSRLHPFTRYTISEG
ncbi:hypothetical protein F5I97DRAFT_459483 [Phlebopus sp. FC_14]|nr:hypothetical protein F5I97DRAFT_459483 [Phlebopus sp. FC_14]